MKQLYSLTILIFLVLTTSRAQTQASDSNKIIGKALDEIVFTKVEQEAVFPGGVTAWMEYVQKSIKKNVPDANAPKGKYQVIVRFIVDKKGAVSDVQAETDFGFGMEKEAIRIIKKSPKWEAALQNGKPVNAYRRQPLTFIVD